ncbi:DNA repair protein RecN [Isosphaera pallida ATCC 43644]|uniref:DNA repair protein RecN n=2 Tax=Isosphaera pallida TaxID=128 RepID=E8R4A5_ISOPI|nr:DNA repair protein RecN [Isosphaera pallida ATCC 43644]
MLLEVSVKNLALIEDARVELKPGLCAWTGETGAGKSLLLTALGLVMGAKASPELVREGKEEARASAVFDLSDPLLKGEVEAVLGGEIEEETLIVTRRLGAQGRSWAHVNGVPVTAATLKALSSHLLDLHSQQDARALADPDRQRGWLDAFGKLEPLRLRYCEARAVHAALLQRRRELVESAEQRDRELELLRFECEELAAARPVVGEYEELQREARRLANARRFREAVQGGHHWLYEADGSAVERIQKVARDLHPLSADAPELAELAETLERLADETREAAYALRSLGRAWTDDPRRLDEIETRLALYRKLAGRFRRDPDELADHLVHLQHRLDNLERAAADLDALDSPLNAAWNELRQTAADLSAARSRAARVLARDVQNHLKDLALPEARLTIEVATAPLGDNPTMASPPEHGVDRVEFLFAPNPGEPPRPLRKIASGGELARVTLAIKTVLADADRVPTLIFDEIDAAVGGRLGASLGRKLSELARHHQIICVTHMPQLASFAAHQWVIRKETRDGRTLTTITALDETERIEELAAMLRGDSVADGTRREVRAMLAEARGG